MLERLEREQLPTHSRCVHFTLYDKEIGLLEDLAELHFNNNKSHALRQAIGLAALVYAHVRSDEHGDVANALAAYARANAQHLGVGLHEE